MTTAAPLQVAPPNYPAVVDVQQVGKWLGLNAVGGMPMVVLCGQNVTKKVVAWDK